MSIEVRKAAAADRNAYLREICTTIGKNFGINDSRQAYGTMRMFQKRKSNFGRINKGGQGNTLSVEKRLKILPDHISETKKYPNQRP
eukprot:snap_masked-scaffold_9-processed-gene-11.28-mRNA-1 protein AED:1.00 eAED:1.00 QI:0/-1/0/0/-1/1/1/0/86